MGLEDMESIEMPENVTKETMGIRFSDMESLNADLMPKIRFTTDPEEAEESGVFYVGPGDTDGETETGGTPEADESTGIPRFTRDADGPVDVARIPRFQKTSLRTPRASSPLPGRRRGARRSPAGTRANTWGPVWRRSISSWRRPSRA